MTQPPILVLRHAQVDPKTLIGHPLNPNVGDVAAIAASIRANGQYRSVVVNQRTGYLVAGHHTVKAAIEAGLEAVAVEYVDVDEDAALRIMLADNATARKGSDDPHKLRDLFAVFDASARGFEGTGGDRADMLAAIRELEGVGDRIARPKPNAEGQGSLARRFGIPPFTIINSASGFMMERKKHWNALGISSTEGREEGLTYTSKPGDFNDRMKAIGTTSEFSGALAELIVRWYSPPGGRVLDPFAGGSVRGLVTTYLGRDYVGVDLRPEQIDANTAQWGQVRKGPWAGRKAPTWLVGNSADLARVLGAHGQERFDAAFTCPPYFDLEVYSERPEDLSRMSEEAFRAEYAKIIKATYDALADDAFFVCVVGNFVRKGQLYMLSTVTTEAAKAAGFSVVNEAIYVTPAGSLALRAQKNFKAKRRLGNQHQYVLVFAKGDPGKAAARNPLGEEDFDASSDDLDVVLPTEEDE